MSAIAPINFEEDEIAPIFIEHKAKKVVCTRRLKFQMASQESCTHQLKFLMATLIIQCAVHLQQLLLGGETNGSI